MFPRAVQRGLNEVAFHLFDDGGEVGGAARDA
jgi:hypothetical protein